MNLELYDEFTKMVYTFWIQYTPILQRELEIEGLLPQKQLEKEESFIKHLLSLQLATKYFYRHNSQEKKHHTANLCFQIIQGQVQQIYSTSSPPIDQKDRIAAYIAANLTQFQETEKGKLIPFKIRLPYFPKNYTTLIGNTYLDSSTQSLWIFVYDLNFYYTVEANPQNSIAYFNLKIICLKHYDSDSSQRKLATTEKSLENHIKEEYPELLSNFSSIIGLTLKEYHFHQRMNLVLQKLYFENKAIKEIAFDLEYNSDNTLYVDITKHFKVTSSQIKRYNYIKYKRS